MKLQVKGIKQGQTVQLLETVDLPDGEVVIEFQIGNPSRQTERLQRLNKLFGVWKDRPNIDLIFAEIDQERHSYYGREVNLDALT